MKQISKSTAMKLYEKGHTIVCQSQSKGYDLYYKKSYDNNETFEERGKWFVDEDDKSTIIYY